MSVRGSFEQGSRLSAPMVSRTTTNLRICYIHIGTHKTGTTSIQVFLASNRARFLANGVFWPAAGSDGDPGVASHHELARELCASAVFNPDRGGLDAVVDELRRTDARVACLSSEDLTFSWDKPSALVRLRDGVINAGFTPRIVVYLRPQASYCTAVYAECVRHGYRMPFADYLRDILGRGQYVWGDGSGPPLDYVKLLDPFASVFGRESMIVRRYRSAAPSASLLHSFARVLLPDDVDLRDFTLPQTRCNGSLDFAGVLRLLGSESPVRERVRFSPLDLAQTVRLGLRFQHPNASLARRYGVHVPAFEALDIGLALPVRRTLTKTRALRSARRALATRPATGN